LQNKWTELVTIGQTTGNTDIEKALNSVFNGLMDAQQESVNNKDKRQP
jgi:hypothetical protein